VPSLLHDNLGNVREIENLIQRAIVLAHNPLITAEDLTALTGRRTRATGRRV
jgi:DNA-binding NtrC family response regulator